MNYVVEVLLNTWSVIVQVTPYLLLGTVIAGLIRSFLKTEQIRDWLSQSSVGAVVRAALAGAPLPLCSCSVLPVALQLRRAGASRGATASFLVSTPQTGVDSVFLTIGLINPLMAAARVIGAVTTGTITGILQNADDRLTGYTEAGEEAPKAACGSCCGHKKPAGNGEDGRSLWSRLFDGQNYAFQTLLPDLSKFLAVGVLLTGFVMTVIPDRFFEGYLGGGIVGMLVVALAGAAVYICATASTPLAAALIAKGMSPGTALVLLLAGPVTSFASMTAVRSMIGTRGLAIYLATIILTAIGLGLAFDAVILWAGIDFLVKQATMAHEHASLFWQVVAGLLVAYLVAVRVLPHVGAPPVPSPG